MQIDSKKLITSAANQGPSTPEVVKKITGKLVNDLSSLKSEKNKDEQLKKQNDGNHSYASSNKNFNLFTHHKKLKNNEQLDYTYETLKEAVLELYLSVKIRSDEEIDHYNEKFFQVEKKQMGHLDGFTLIDYIKSSIEILMNMKGDSEPDEEGNGSHMSLTSYDARNKAAAAAELLKQMDKEMNSNKHKYHNIDMFGNDQNQINLDKQVKKAVVQQQQDEDSKQQNTQEDKREGESNADMLDTSSKFNLDAKLDQIKSPSDSKVSIDDQDGGASAYSIPAAHQEYEKILRQLEAECRNHIKCEQQMKLHIECLQEKLEQRVNDIEKLRKAELCLEEQKKEMDRLRQLHENEQEQTRLQNERVRAKERELQKLFQDKAQQDSILQRNTEVINDLKAQLRNSQSKKININQNNSQSDLLEDYSDKNAKAMGTESSGQKQNITSNEPILLSQMPVGSNRSQSVIQSTSEFQNYLSSQPQQAQFGPLNNQISSRMQRHKTHKIIGVQSTTSVSSNQKLGDGETGATAQRFHQQQQLQLNSSSTFSNGRKAHNIKHIVKYTHPQSNSSQQQKGLIITNKQNSKNSTNPYHQNDNSYKFDKSIAHQKYQVSKNGLAGKQQTNNGQILVAQSHDFVKNKNNFRSERASYDSQQRNMQQDLASQIVMPLEEKTRQNRQNRSFVDQNHTHNISKSSSQHQQALYSTSTNNQNLYQQVLKTQKRQGHQSNNNHQRPLVQIQSNNMQLQQTGDKNKKIKKQFFQNTEQQRSESVSKAMRAQAVKQAATFVNVGVKSNLGGPDHQQQHHQSQIFLTSERKQQNTLPQQQMTQPTTHVRNKTDLTQNGSTEQIGNRRVEHNQLYSDRAESQENIQLIQHLKKGQVKKINVNKQNRKIKY